MPTDPKPNPGFTPLSELTAEELAVRCQRGSLGCYSELVGRFEGRLFNFLLRRTASRQDAEDLAQEAFVRAWERIATYNPAWRFSTWLFTIASRLAISRHRRNRRQRPTDSFDRADTGAPDPARVAGDRELGSILWELAETKLNQDQRTALWLRYAEDLSIGEIATVMRKSHVGVRVCLFRARQSLAEAAARRSRRAAAAPPQPAPAPAGAAEIVGGIG